MPASTAPRSAVLAAMALLTLAAAPARAGGLLDPYLPKSAAPGASGTIAGHVVTFAVAPEDQAISARFRQAVQGNMDWFQRVVRSSPPGVPLPYDTKMGVTAAEYDRLLHLKPAVTEGAAVTIGVDRGIDGGVRLKAEGAAAALSGIAFPPDEKTATTPVGTLNILTPMHVTDSAGPLGAWTGAEWAAVKPADADEPSAKLAFGRREADGGGVLYYQVAAYKDHPEQSLVVFYKLD